MGVVSVLGASTLVAPSTTSAAFSSAFGASCAATTSAAFGGSGACLAAKLQAH